MLAHGEEYLTVFNDAPPEDARIAELVKLSRRHGVTVTANVQGIATIAAQGGKPEAVAQYLQRPEALRTPGVAKEMGARGLPEARRPVRGRSRLRGTPDHRAA